MIQSINITKLNDQQNDKLNDVMKPITKALNAVIEYLSKL